MHSLFIRFSYKVSLTSNGQKVRYAGSAAAFIVLKVDVTLTQCIIKHNETRTAGSPTETREKKSPSKW